MASFNLTGHGSIILNVTINIKQFLSNSIRVVCLWLLCNAYYIHICSILHFSIRELIYVFMEGPCYMLKAALFLSLVLPVLVRIKGRKVDSLEFHVYILTLKKKLLLMNV